MLPAEREAKVGSWATRIGSLTWGGSWHRSPRASMALVLGYSPAVVRVSNNASGSRRIYGPLVGVVANAASLDSHSSDAAPRQSAAIALCR